MKIALIIIGSEILQGKIQDANTQYLASKLLRHGVDLKLTLTCPDDENQITNALNYLKDQVDVILTSGGMGPTLDDITKNVLAKYFKLETAFSQQALEVTIKNYQRLGRSYENTLQHYHILPVGFQAINNPTGHAPGLSYSFENKQIFCLPGVPHEFESMFEQVILPELLEKNHSKTMIHLPLTIKTSRVPESVIFNQLCPDLWKKLSHYGQVSSLPHLLGVDIGVLLIGSASEISQQKAEIAKIIQAEKIASHLIGIFDHPIKLEEIIVELCQQKKLTIGFAESCTGGLNSSRITDVAGASQILKGSIIAYSNQIKIEQLSVDAQILNKFGAVSTQVAAQMAQGLKEKYALDIAISSSGIKGPSGGSADKPVGSLCLGIASKRGVHSERFNYTGNRTQLKQRFSQISLLKLIDEIKLL
jgi:nicotinamide-nucleotide amidase